MEEAVKQKTSAGARTLYFILMGFAALGIGSLMGFIGGANEGYAGLVRPPFTPPDVTFSIVWSVLYFIMGGAFYLTLAYAPKTHEERNVKNAAVLVSVVSFLVNITWTPIFFKADLYFFAFIWLAILDAMITALVILEFKVSKAAAIMNIPYLGWLLFATALNIFIAIYN